MRKLLFIIAMVLCVGISYAQETGGGQESQIAPQITANNQAVDTAETDAVNDAVNSDSIDSTTINTVSDAQNQPLQDNGNINEGKTPYSMILSGVAILLCIILFFYCRKAKKSDPRKEDRMRDSIDGLRNDINLLTSQLKSLQSSVGTLERKVADLSKKPANVITERKESAPKNTNTDQNVKPTKRQEVLYAGNVKGDVFIGDSLKKQPDKYTSFILTVCGSEGTFIVNNAPEVQKEIISSFQYKMMKAVEIKNKVSAPQKVVTLEPGQIVKSGNDWHIIVKAIVDIK